MDNKQHDVSIRNQIYQQLMEQFCSGKIAVGERITEKQIEKQFSVSRAPVREALVKLCHENVLESVPRVGYRLRELTYKDLAEIAELRLYLELGSLSNIFKRLNEESLDGLRRLNEERTHFVPSEHALWLRWSNNLRFHLALNKIAGNEQVYQVLERCIATNSRAYAQLYPFKHEEDFMNQYHSRHDAIVSALERHDIFHAYIYLEQDIVHLQSLLSKYQNSATM